MSNDITAGTPGTTDAKTEDAAGAAPKTYTETEVQDLIGKATKEGETKSYRHWQSIADKVVAAEKTRNQALATELQGLKDKAFETLSPEDRTKAIWEEIKAGKAAPAGGEQSKDSPGDKGAQDAGAGSDDQVAVIRGSINEALKDAGVDPAKVDWADDASGPEAMKRFLKSIVTQLKPAETPKGAVTEASRVDTSRSAGGAVTVDLKSIDPTALITSGLSKPWKG